MTAGMLTAMMASCFDASPTIPQPVLHGNWPTQGWERTTPEAQGVDSERLASMVTGLRSQQGEIHSLQIVRHGALILDAYFYPYLGSAPHDVASVTKSVTTTLVGAAIERAHLAGLETSITEVLGRNKDFPELTDLTVADAAAMRTGQDCGLHPDERELMSMIQSSDWIDFALRLPVTAPPGERFAYCSPGMHLLSAVLSATTGETAAAFANEALFKPLGFGATQWPADPQGVSHGWGDLRLLPRDMAKIGLLYLHDGVWEGQRLLPKGWVADSIAARSQAENGDGYGLGWWRPTGVDGVIAANGRGGQSISIVPALDMVVVVTGSGFDLGSIAGDLLGAVQAADALPANPGGVAALTESIALAGQPIASSIPDQRNPFETGILGKRYVFPDNPVGFSELELEQPTERQFRFCLGLSGLLGPAQRTRSCFAAAWNGEWTISPQGFRDGFAAAVRLIPGTGANLSLELAEPASPNSITMHISATKPNQLTLALSERTGLFTDVVLVGCMAGDTPLHPTGC